MLPSRPVPNRRQHVSLQSQSHFSALPRSTNRAAPCHQRKPIKQSRRSPIMSLLRSGEYSTGCSARWDSSLTSGFATEGPSLTRQKFAVECDINVLMAHGRCLRPALYSSLRSSPSHPTGVSALRVTIAIANARFARKQWGFASQLPSRGGSFAMNRPPADMFGQALLNDHRNDPYCILSQIAAIAESLLAWKLGPRNQRPRRAR